MFFKNSAWIIEKKTNNATVPVTCDSMAPLQNMVNVQYHCNCGRSRLRIAKELNEIEIKEI